MSKKIFLLTLPISLAFMASFGNAMAQVQADGFIRVPGGAVGNDEYGRVVVCPVGSKAVGVDCEMYGSKKRVKGELPQDFLARTQRKNGAEYVGLTADAAVGGGVVLYFNVSPPCIGPNGSSSQPDGTLWSCRRTRGGQMNVQPY